MPSSSWLRAVPAWAWLVGIVAGSAVFRVIVARDMPGPFIFVDELIYSELAKSFAAGGHFLVRGVPTAGYGIVYPILISPAYRLFDRLPEAYAAVKVLNSIAMSLAAVPAYFLARRLVRKELALLAALLTVAVPSLAYTGTVMTENAFYPLFLCVVLALVAALERPTLILQITVLLLVLVAYLARAQAITFVPAVLVAPLLFAWLGREPLRQAIRRFAWTYGILAAGGVLVVAVQLARGRSLQDLLGAYAVVGERHYSVREVADFVLWHTADLALYVGVIPLAAAIVVVARARRESRPVQAFVAAAVPVAVAFVVVVAAFATHFASDRLHERNLFQLAPLLFVALLVWVDGRDGGFARSWPLELGAVAAAAALPLTIPYDRFIGEPARADTLILLPLWTINRHYPAGSALLTVGLVSAALGVLLLAVPRGAAVALPVVVVGWFALLLPSVVSGAHGFKVSSAGAVFQGIRGVPRGWIDKAVPKGSDVPVLWSGPPVDRFVVNQNEFFNRSVGQVYYTSVPTPGGLYEKRVVFGPDHFGRTDDGRLVRSRYLLADSAITPDGEVVARDPALGMTVWRLRGPLYTTTSTVGLYPHDSWSGKHVMWTRRRCRGGTLRVTLHSGPELFTGPNRVVASVGGRTAAVTVPRIGYVSLRVPLPAGTPTCTVRFTVAKTLVPSVVTSGKSTDDRALGAHFDAFDYQPAR